MKLEFLENISEGGKYEDVMSDQLVRLFDFDHLQAEQFRLAIQKTIIERGEALDLTNLDFITSLNCKLKLDIADTDIGITMSDKKNFICELTVGGYKNLIYLLEPFCNKKSDSHQWLYDIDTPIDFLFSTSGSW